MINMHHCRIQNTLEALRECCETLEYEEIDNLSESEQKALAHLLKLCEKLGRFYAPDPPPALPTKVCSACNEAKPLDQFNTRNGGAALLNSCKPCRNRDRRNLRKRTNAALTAEILKALQDGPLTALELAKRVRSSVQAVGHVAAASDHIISARDWRQTFVTYRLTDTGKPPKRKPRRPCLRPETTDPNVKTCTKCKKNLPETEFRFRLADAHMRHTRCKHCMTLDDSANKIRRAALIADIMPLVFDLLTQYGPMQHASIVALLQQQHPDIQVTYQRLNAAVQRWEHGLIERQRDRRGMEYVYRIVGDTRPVYFAHNAVPGPGGGTERAVDDPEGDAWFVQLQAEVAERRAHRERLRAACV